MQYTFLCSWAGPVDPETATQNFAVVANGETRTEAARAAAEAAIDSFELSIPASRFWNSPEGARFFTAFQGDVAPALSEPFDCDVVYAENSRAETPINCIHAEFLQQNRNRLLEVLYSFSERMNQNARTIRAELKGTSAAPQIARDFRKQGAEALEVAQAIKVLPYVPCE
ncbi:hypothetical protein [Streptomyces sp. 891-h]|uniref:hypothetical protein n=1 Tax=Streptomyces sp. 891-h TaxID=2720714 RepID=UPI001FAA4859|nr:hypothetical protein [Streptomyces sp. 891-h]UNZ22326.1 hypothetical protein HC362_34740 [Streptomyces sp. 891-h]